MGCNRVSLIGRYGLAVCVGAGVLVPAVAGAQLVPHRAIYDISLERADEASAIATFSGRMVIDVVAADCSGLATSSRYVFRSGSAEGATLLTDLRTAHWEAKDGSTFRFLTRRFDDSKLTEETDGNAERTGDGGLEISVTSPKKLDAKFDADVMFPTQHLNTLIAAGRDNTRTVTARIYEGAEPGDQVYDTFAVIGPRKQGAQSGPGNDVLGDLVRWPVTVSYFPGEGSQPDNDDTAGGEEVPVYSISSDLFENGVSANVILDYGDFALRGELTDISFPDVPECE